MVALWSSKSQCQTSLLLSPSIFFLFSFSFLSTQPLQPTTHHCFSIPKSRLVGDVNVLKQGGRVYTTLLSPDPPQLTRRERAAEECFLGQKMLLKVYQEIALNRITLCILAADVAFQNQGYSLESPTLFLCPVQRERKEKY